MAPHVAQRPHPPGPAALVLQASWLTAPPKERCLCGTGALCLKRHRHPCRVLQALRSIAGGAAPTHAIAAGGRRSRCRLSAEGGAKEQRQTLAPSSEKSGYCAYSHDESYRRIRPQELARRRATGKRMQRNVSKTLEEKAAGRGCFVDECPQRPEAFRLTKVNKPPEPESSQTSPRQTRGAGP